MIVREATEKDVKFLTELARITYIDAFGDSFTPEDLKDVLERDQSEGFFEKAINEHIILIAENNTQMLGYIKFGKIGLPIDNPHPSDKELHRLFVHPEFQNQGVGKNLMNNALTHPLFSQARNIYLDVWEYNPGAKRFYERYGFQEIGNTGLNSLPENLVTTTS